MKSISLPATPTAASQNHASGKPTDGANRAGEAKRGGLRSVPVFVVVLLIVILFQWLGSAYACEFSGPDEAAHLVTGLMVRDYIASGFPGTPITYAEKYYVHYPKVAFAMWGPLLHFTEAGWLLVFPSTRTSLLVLMAAITAGTAFLTYGAIVDEFGTIFGLVGAFLFVAIPIVQRYTGMIMADGLVALLDFCAAMAFGRYLNTRKPKDVLLFAAYTCLSILTKGNGVALVLLPGFAILFTRAFSVLKLRSFWIAVAIIGAIAGPWQYYSASALIGIADRPAAWKFFLPFGRSIVGFLGVALLPVIVIGIYKELIAPAWARTVDGKWAAAGALICSVWGFHCLLPGAGPEVRYMLALIPALLLFLTAGMSSIVGWIATPGIPGRTWHWVIAAAVVAIFLLTAFSIPRKSHYGFDRAAALIERPDFKDTVILVSSESEGGEGEGMLISEVAMREKRPSHIILRATKMLSQSDWLGAHYKLLYHTPAQIMSFLRSIPVGIVVIDSEPGSSGTPDYQLLRQAIADFPDEWEHLETYTGDSSKIDVYHLKSATGQARGKILIDLPYTLKRHIEY